MSEAVARERLKAAMEAASAAEAEAVRALESANRAKWQLLMAEHDLLRQLGAEREAAEALEFAGVLARRNSRDIIRDALKLNKLSKWFG